jgi:hypothetical protein
MDALGQSRAHTPPRYAEILADAGVRPPTGEPDEEDAPPESMLGPSGPLVTALPVNAALDEPTPPQGVPGLFERMLDVPTVPSAPPAPRASTYPVQTPLASPDVTPIPGTPVSAAPISGAPVSGAAGYSAAGYSAAGHELAAAHRDSLLSRTPPVADTVAVQPPPPQVAAPPPQVAAPPPQVAAPPPQMAAPPPQMAAPPPQMAAPPPRPAASPVTFPQVPEIPEIPEVTDAPADISQRHRAEPGHGLPKRVPAEPDVPRAPEPTAEPPAPAPALSRIASGLRRDDLPPSDRPNGFDVAAVLSAVRDVPGVRDAQLRANSTGGHTLRLDLADGSDPAYVSRVVARMLNERMGLIAEPPDMPAGGPAEAAEAPRPAPTAPMQGGWQAPVASREPPEEDTAPRMPFPPAQRSGPPLPPGLIPASSAPREPRRRHPVPMRGRYPADMRPGPSPTDRLRDDLGQDRPPALTPPTGARRVVLDHVQVSTFGLDATVEVRLVFGDRVAMGVSNGPAVDGYVLRLCAAAAANAVDELLGEAGMDTPGSGPGGGRGHCYVEQAAIVPMGSCEVAVVVVLLVCGGWVEQLAGSALVSSDPRQAVVRATLAAVNRRLTALLP